MINIAALVALRDRATADPDNHLQRAASSAPAGPEQDPAPAEPAAAGSTYPAKSLALENGRYRVVDHDK